MSYHRCQLIIFYTLTLLCSCNTGDDRAIKNVKTDTINKEKKIPYYEDETVHHTRQQLFLQNLGKIMGLSSLSNGKNGLFIRIWVWSFDKNYVIDISDDGINKESYIIEWNSKKIDSSEYIIIHNEWKNLRPKSGWSNFFATVQKYQIPTMENGKSAKEQTQHLTQMTYVQFEIAQPCQYRFYEYLEPSYYRYVDVGSKNVYGFLEYFNEEMNVQIYNPVKQLFVNPK